MGAKNALPGRQTGPQVQWAGGYKLQGLGTVTGTNTYTSEIFNMTNFDDVGLQIQFTGTPTGTLTVQVSINNVTYDTIPTQDINPSIVSPTGSATDNVYSIKLTPYPYLRVTYTNSSGSGTLSVWVSGKDLN